MYKSTINNYSKMTLLTTSIALALTSWQAAAISDGKIMAGTNQLITLTPEEQYTNTSGNIILEAYRPGGKITGDNVNVTIDRNAGFGRYIMLKAYNGGQIGLTNSDINLMTTSVDNDDDLVFSATDTNAAVKIADSTVYSYARLGDVSNGASASLSNSTFSAGRGIILSGIGSRLDILDNTDITLRGDSYALEESGIVALSGSILNIEDSRIKVLDNGNDLLSPLPPNPYAVTVRGGSSQSAPLTTASINDSIIETYGYQSTGIEILFGNVAAAVNNLSIITHGLGGTAMRLSNNHATTSLQSTASLSNSSIETFGYAGDGVHLSSDFTMTMDNVDITTHGDRGTGISLNTGNNSSQPTLTASNVDITMSGKDNRGIANVSANTYLNNIRIMMSGNNATGLFVGVLSSTGRATIDNMSTLVSGDNSTGMFLGGMPDISFNNNSIRATGNNSHGLTVGYLLAKRSSALPMVDSHIEALEGYALRSINADLDLDLTRSTLTGRRGGEAGIAVSVEDNGEYQSGVVDVTASDNSHIYGDAVSQSVNAAALNLTLNSSSTMTGRMVRGYSMALDDTSRWNLTGDSDVTTLNNLGTVVFDTPTDNGAFKTLTVGDYVGGGTLIMNTALGDDSSATDKLIVSGSTAGTTKLYVNNFHGSGTTTVNGIEVISVGGQSDGQFTLENRALAGAYEYFLHQDNGDWYLRSALAPEPPEPQPQPQPLPEPEPEPEQPGEQTPPAQPVDPVTPAKPAPEPTPVQKPQIYRPEAGAYLANLAAANRLFNHSLKDREGGAEDSSMWLRQVAFRNQSRDGSGQLQMRSNNYVIQGGGELWNGRFGTQDRLGVGVMAGYGYSNGNTHSSESHYDAKNSVRGYSTGAYATWYQNAESLNGVYVDSWLQYSWLRASVKGEELADENYDISGLSASLEGGYRHTLTQSDSGALFITPQAQVIWSGIKADRHQEVNGTRVDGSGNAQTRLGLNLSYDALSAQKGAKPFTVYGEVNWLHNTSNAHVTMDNVRVEQAGSRNVGEVKLGFEGQPTEALTLWTNFAQRVGTEHYTDTSVNVGIKYQF